MLSRNREGEGGPLQSGQVSLHTNSAKPSKTSGKHRTHVLSLGYAIACTKIELILYNWGPKVQGKPSCFCGIILLRP